MRGLTPFERDLLADASAPGCDCSDEFVGEEFSAEQELAIQVLADRGLVAPYLCFVDPADRHWRITAAGRDALLADDVARGRVTV